MNIYKITISFILMYSLHLQAEDTAAKANEKINSALGTVNVKSKISKCANVTVEPWLVSEPMPTDYQLEVTAKPIKNLSACGCKNNTSQAYFVLQNKAKSVIQTQEWWVTSPTGAPLKYTMNLPTNQSQILIPPITLKVCCIGDRCN